jgi:hypothetical protein
MTFQVIDGAFRSNGYLNKDKWSFQNGPTNLEPLMIGIINCIRSTFDHFKKVLG